MNYSEHLQVEEVVVEGKKLKLCVPDPQYVRRRWQRRAAEAPFPFWSQLWPAALALARFVLRHPGYVRQREVLELGAGLGLPSLAAALSARRVWCSDYLPEAVETARRSGELNEMTNLHFQLLDWSLVGELPPCDTLLLSDINYEPAQFENLHQLLRRFLQQKTTILLSTPQRLAARDFLHTLMPWCIASEEFAVDHQGEEVSISVLVLRED